MAELTSRAARKGDRAIPRAHVARGDGRLLAAQADLQLDPVARPSEQERALMISLLAGLVGQIAEELALRLPEPTTPSVDAGEIIDRLRHARQLATPELTALLMRRADLVALRAASGGQGGADLLAGWAADPEPAVAAAAMAVVIARASSRDRFGRPGLALADCDAETAVGLTYAIAAALDGPAEPLVAAAVDLLARHDEGQRLDAEEARLVRALEQAGRIDAGLLLALATRGEIGLLGEALARIARIPGSAAWAMLVAHEEAALGCLLRLSEQPRTVAAGLIAALAGPLGLSDPGIAIASFDAMTAAEATAERARLRLPAAFLNARSALEQHG